MHDNQEAASAPVKKKVLKSQRQPLETKKPIFIFQQMKPLTGHAADNFKVVQELFANQTGSVSCLQAADDQKTKTSSVLRMRIIQHTNVGDTSMLVFPPKQDRACSFLRVSTYTSE